MDDLLRFIRSYGHDFLNHLQVISGYAQLNKTERIREYIGQVVTEVRSVNALARLNSSGVAAGLLGLREQAARYGVPLSITVADELPSPSTPPGWRPALAVVGGLFAALEGSAVPVLLAVESDGGNTVVRLVLPLTPALTEPLLQRLADAAGGHLALSGGSVQVRRFEDRVAVVLRG